LTDQDPPCVVESIEEEEEEEEEEEDLKRMKIVGWRAKFEDRQEWNRTVEQKRPTQGCRVNRRRRRRSIM
jgi:hypothetical protein